MGSGHRSQFGQRRLLAGQLGRAWSGHRGRQQRGHLGVPKWRLVGVESPASSRSAVAASRASGSGAGVAGRRLISADHASSSAFIGYTTLRA